MDIIIHPVLSVSLHPKTDRASVGCPKWHKPYFLKYTTTETQFVSRLHWPEIWKCLLLSLGYTSIR